MTADSTAPVFVMERADDARKYPAATGPGSPVASDPVMDPVAGPLPGPVTPSPVTISPVTDPVTPGPVDVEVPASALPGTGMAPVLTETARAGTRVRLSRRSRAWMAEFADYQRRHRTFWHAVAVFVTRPPETWEQTDQHLNSRKWLQEWMTGRFRWFCEWENVAWAHLVARPGKTVLRLAEKVFFERQLGFWLALGFIGLCVLIRMLGG